MTSERVRYEAKGVSGRLKVVDRGRCRTLYLDGLPQTTIDLDDPARAVSRYTAYFHLGTLLRPDPRRVGLLGLGGGAAVHSFYRAYPCARLTAVEIDPEVVQVARRFFSLPDDRRVDVVVGDARNYLAGTERRFGHLVLDAYDGEGYPDRLYTRESFQIMAEALGPPRDGAPGVLSVNMVGWLRGERSSSVRTVLRTLAAVFSSVYLFEVGQSFWRRLLGRGNNFVVLAENRDRPLDDRGLRRRLRGSNTPGDGPDLASLLRHRRSLPPLDDVPILSDARLREGSVLRI